MKKLFLYNILLMCLILCNNAPLHAQKKRKSNPHEQGEDIHKHYTGTIGSRAVVFDITWGWQGGSNYGGSYFYYPDEPGMKHFYISEPKTFDHDEILYCTVVPENTKPGDDFFFDRDQPTEKMEFTITGKHLRGKWHSANKKEMDFINAIEDYSDAVPLQIKFYNNSTLVTNSKGNNFRVAYSFIGTVPLGNDQATPFINDATTKFMGSTGDNTMDEYLKARSEKYFSEVNTKKENIPADKYADIYQRVWLMVAYNGNDILVLKKEIISIWPKRLVNNPNRFLILDLANEKQIKLKDILTIDKNKLSALLEKSFRNRYSIPATKKLNTVFKVNRIPFTTNVAIVNGGLLFSYDYYSLYPKHKDDFMKSSINIFIPYTDLQDLLKPGFKHRIGI